jgi:tripartite-type tricarboxylate transporter receptor subunit TctC
VPAEVIARLNSAAATAIKSDVFGRLATSEGLVMVGGPPDELDRYWRGEEARWLKVIQQAGIKVQ